MTSVGTVRGAGYLILVGRRPGAANGEFDLRADLVLPPDNDERGEAEEISRLPATVRGSARRHVRLCARCSAAGGTVWYRVKGPATGRLLVQLTTGDRDGVVCFRRSRSAPLHRGLCRDESRREGSARLRDEGRRRVPDRGRRQERLGPGRLHPDGGRRAPERLPGRSLPQRGAHTYVHGLTDVNDVWSVRLRRGTMYRIAFNSQPCANATFRRGNVTPPPRLRGYATFTPGPDGGGRYSLEVRATPRPEQQAYRLRVVAAAADDVGVGLELSPGSIQGTPVTPRRRRP